MCSQIINKTQYHESPESSHLVLDTQTIGGLFICQNKQLVIWSASYITKNYTCDLVSWVSFQQFWLVMNTVTIPLMHSFLCEMSSSYGCEVSAKQKRRDSTNSIILVIIGKNKEFNNYRIIMACKISELLLQQKMILSRFKLVGYSLMGTRYNLSTLKPQTKSRQMPSTNPLARKSFQQINRIISTVNSQNEITIYGLALNAIYQHLINEKVRLAQFNSRQNKLKQEIMNKCMNKLLTDTTKTTPQQLCIIVKIINQMYGIRAIKINEQNLNLYRKQIPQQIRIQIEQDKQGKYVEDFKSIFYAMLKAGKRYIVLKTLFVYLMTHDLKSNQQCLKFFKKIGEFHNNGFYDDLVEIVVSNFVNSKYNTLENAHQWAKPIVIDVMKSYCNRFQVEQNYGRKFRTALASQIKKEKLQTNQKIILLSCLLEWLVQFSHYPTVLQNHLQLVDLISLKVTQIKNELKNGAKLEFETFKKIDKVSFRFEQIAKQNARFINKTQNQFLAELQQLYEIIIDKSFIDKISTLNSGQIVSVIKYRLNISRQLQDKLIQNLFDHMNKHVNDSHLISRIRIPQYITRDILITNSQEYKDRISIFLKNLQKNFGSLREFQILRIYNILYLLNIKSKLFQQYLKQKSDQHQQNQEEIVQNISRTNLRDFGHQIVKQQLTKLVNRFKRKQKQELRNVQRRSKRNGVKVINFQIIKCIWYSFKRFELQKNIHNINPAFQFWLQDNYQTFKQILQQEINFQSFMNIAYKQMTVYNNETPCSINYQIIIEALKIWKESKKKSLSQEKSKIMFDSLRSFCESSNIFSLCSRDYRYSFFVKILWAQYHLGKQYLRMKQQYKCKRQIQQVLLMAKYDKPALYREMPSLSSTLILRTLQLFQLFSEIKMKHYENYIQYIFWIKKNNLPNVAQLETDYSWIAQTVVKQIKQYFGNSHAFQYLVFINKIQQNLSQQDLNLLNDSSIPPQIYNGTLTKESKLNDLLLLDLLQFSRSTIYFCKKYPRLGNIIVDKIMQIKEPIPNFKLVQATNLVNDLSGLVARQTQVLFDSWIRNKILSLGSPLDNPSLVQLYTKFNIIPEQHRNIVMEYAKQNMTCNNYFLAQTIFINGFTGVTKQAYQLLRICQITKVPSYLLDSFPSQLYLLISSFLGICLNQNDTNLLKEAINLYVKPYIIEREILSENLTPQLYILLSVSQLRLKQQESSKLLKNLLSQIQNKDPNIKSKALERISIQNAKIMKKFDIKLEVDDVSKLAKFEQKTVYIKYNRPGWDLVIQEYLHQCANIPNAIGMSLEQLLKK